MRRKIFILLIVILFIISSIGMAETRNYKVITNLEFDSVGNFKSNGLAIVELNGKRGYINEKGQAIIKPQFDSVDDFQSNGLAKVKLGSQWGYINEKGEMIIECQYDVLDDFQSNGLASVNIDGKWGYIDEKGEKIIEPQFDFADDFATNGLARVKLGSRWGYINEKGKKIIEPQFDFADDFQSNGLARVNIDGKWGYIDEKGEMIIEPRFDRVNDFASNGLAGVKLGSRWGYINEKGKKIIELQFDFASDFATNGLARVNIDGKWGYINEEGEMIIEPQFNEINDYGLNGLAKVYLRGQLSYSDGKWGYINEKGEMIIEPQFDSVGDFKSNGLVFVTRNLQKSDPDYTLSSYYNKKVGLANDEGKILVEPSFTNIEEFNSDGIAKIEIAEEIQSQIHSKFGYINKMGEVIIEPEFDYIGDFASNGLAAAEINGSFGYINKEGKFVIEPQFKMARDFSSEGIAVISHDGFKFSIIKLSDNSEKNKVEEVEKNNKIGDDIGDVLFTDIVTKMNGHLIESFNIKGKTSIYVKELRKLGYSVLWDGENRKIKVELIKPKDIVNTKLNFDNYKRQDDNLEIGSNVGDVLFTDIQTFLSNNIIESYNINGTTAIQVSDLEKIGLIIYWDSKKREVLINTPGYNKVFDDSGIKVNKFYEKFGIRYAKFDESLLDITKIIEKSLGSKESFLSEKINGLKYFTRAYREKDTSERLDNINNKTRNIEYFTEVIGNKDIRPNNADKDFVANDYIFNYSRYIAIPGNKEINKYSQYYQYLDELIDKGMKEYLAIEGLDMYSNTLSRQLIHDKENAYLWDIKNHYLVGKASEYEFDEGLDMLNKMFFKAGSEYSKKNDKFDHYANYIFDKEAMRIGKPDFVYENGKFNLMNKIDKSWHSMAPDLWKLDKYYISENEFYPELNINDWFSYTNKDKFYYSDINDVEDTIEFHNVTSTRPLIRFYSETDRDAKLIWLLLDELLSHRKNDNPDQEDAYENKETYENKLKTFLNNRPIGILELPDGTLVKYVYRAAFGKNKEDYYDYGYKNRNTGFKLAFLNRKFVDDSAIITSNLKNLFDYELIDNKLGISGYRGNDQTLKIPETIGNLPVEYIGKQAFRNKGLTKIEFPNNITIIGAGAFADNDLTSIELPNGLKVIHEIAFRNNFIESIKIPKEVQFIDRNAFSKNRIKRVILPKKYDKIDYIFDKNVEIIIE